MKKSILLMAVVAIAVLCFSLSISWAGPRRGGEGRMPNPNWVYGGQTVINGVTVVQGTNPQIRSCRIQSKWHRIDRTGRPNPGAQVVITNPGPGCDTNSPRFRAALDRASRLGPVDCGQNDCAVAEH